LTFNYYEPGINADLGGTGELQASSTCSELAETAPKRAFHYSFRISCQRANQPTRAFGFISGLARRIRSPQKPRGSTPPAIGAMKTALVNFSTAIKFFIERFGFSDGLARLVQTVSGKGRRYVFTFVTGQQQPYVQVMIEIVPPGFVKACAKQFPFPKMSRLQRGRA